MNHPPPSRRGVLIFLLGTAAFAGALLLWRPWEGGGDPPAPPRIARTVGFEERAESAGIRFRTTFLEGEQGEKFKINLYDHGSGVAVGDYDGDGLDDVYFVNQLGPNALYRNRGGGRFEDVTTSVGPVALDDRICVSAAFGDVDNDGDPDLYVTSVRGGNVLFRNEGGRFRDVTDEAGARCVAHSQSATFFDADGDGFLDLLVSNTAKWTNETYDPARRYWAGVADLYALVGSPKEENLFLRNRGDGTFEDRTAASGLAGTGWSGDTAVFDFDEDGDLDVAMAHMFGASHLYENDGKGAFTDVVRRVLGRVSWGAVGTKAFDYDGDGRLDLLLVDMHSDMWMPVEEFVPDLRVERAKFAGPFGPNAMPPWGKDFLARVDVPFDDVVFGTTLFRALGGGTFEEVSARAGVETLWPWGAATGDYDLDGWEDVFVPTGMGWPYAYWPPRLLMNRGDGSFDEMSRDAGLDPLPGGPHQAGGWRGRPFARSSRCAATADFDGDGRLDVVVSSFNDRAFLLENRWPARPWVGFRLVGTTSNRDAIGAVVRLKAGGRTFVRQVHAAGGYLAQSSLALHVGLAGATRIDACEITWPSGRKQALDGLAPGRVHRVEEPR